MPDTTIAPGGENPQPSSPTQVTPAAPAAATPTPAPAAPAAEPGSPAAPAAPESNEMTLEKAMATVDFSKLSDDQLRDLESRDPARIAAVLNLPPPGSPAPSAVAEPGAAAPAVPAADPAADDAEGPGRVSLKSLGDKSERVMIANALQMVRDGEAASFKDAMFKLVGAPPAAPAAPDGAPLPAAPAAVVEPAPYVDPVVTDLEGRLAAMQEEHAALKTAYDFDGAEKKLAEMLDVKVELALAKREAVVRGQELQRWEADEDESRAKALGRFGELLTDPASDFKAYIDAEIVVAERRNDPIFNKPDWPEQIAERVYKRLYGKSQPDGAQPPVAIPGATIPPVPSRDVRFPGIPVSSTTGVVGLSVQDALEQIDAMSSEERLEVLALAEAEIKKSRGR